MRTLASPLFVLAVALTLVPSTAVAEPAKDSPDERAAQELDCIEQNTTEK
jgi:hypothetical protein